MTFNPGLAATQPVLLGAGDGRIVHLLGDEMTLKASADQTAGTLGVFECLVPAGAQGPPEHVHVTFDEAFYVLEGVLPLQVKDETTLLPSGAFAFVPRGTRHTFSNPSEAPIRFLTVCTPGGFEGFFVDAARLPLSVPPDFDAINAIALRYDSITVNQRPRAPLA
jgi:mannose-6-phosphate isomerase-like protein (cupin superfamily)